MNLLLLQNTDLISEDRAVVRGRRLLHIQNILKAQPQDELRVGLLDGLLGTGRVRRLDAEEAEFEIRLDREPPPPLPLTLFLALPRPKVLRRVLISATTLGIKKIFLFNAYRVEKSFWHCEQITPSSLHEALRLGLEQSVDTRLPTIQLERRFKPFVEDRAPVLLANSRALLAHPTATQACPRELEGPVTLAIGPEGGFIPYEVEMLQTAGFEAVHFHERILKVETALAALVGRLF